MDFALQQRDGGSWGQRLRSEQHYFPAGAAIGEWLDSSAVAVDSAGRVRISARLGDDGRVEFTLQQQLGDSSWGERLRAQRRFFPAGAAEGVWLVTTPLAVSTPVPAAGGTVETEADGQRAPVACLAARQAGAPIATSSEGSPFEHRSMSGEGNNADHPAWGMAGTALLKLAPNSYADGVSTPTESRPNPRTISNLVFAQGGSVPNSAGASDITWQWGQFIDHDITLSLDNTDEPFPVPVPLGDPVFDPVGAGEALIHVDRSASDPDTGTDRHNPRRQVNAITAFIDASQVYGSDEARAQALRANDGTGRLKTSHDGRFLPYNEHGLDNEGGSHLADLFLDVDDVDMWVAALAEDHAAGASVGETLQAIITDQFRRLRDGDRFWYENDPYFLANPELLDQTRRTTLANIIRCNTPIGHDIQNNAFIVKQS